MALGSPNLDADNSSSILLWLQTEGNRPVWVSHTPTGAGAGLFPGDTWQCCISWI